MSLWFCGKISLHKNGSPFFVFLQLRNSKCKAEIIKTKFKRGLYFQMFRTDLFFLIACRCFQASHAWTRNWWSLLLRVMLTGAHCKMTHITLLLSSLLCLLTSKTISHFRIVQEWPLLHQTDVKWLESNPGFYWISQWDRALAVDWILKLNLKLAYLNLIQIDFSYSLKFLCNRDKPYSIPLRRM